MPRLDQSTRHTLLRIKRKYKPMKQKLPYTTAINIRNERHFLSTVRLNMMFGGKITCDFTYTKHATIAAWECDHRHTEFRFHDNLDDYIADVETILGKQDHNNVVAFIFMEQAVENDQPIPPDHNLTNVIFKHSPLDVEIEEGEMDRIREWNNQHDALQSIIEIKYANTDVETKKFIFKQAKYATLFRLKFAGAFPETNKLYGDTQ